jgi:IMP dehydrogenase
MKDKFSDIRLALTFDDVLLQPNESDVVPMEVHTATRLTNTIGLAIPFVSAPMDTVTEGRMAIALALEGGMGFVHKNLTIEQQRKEVDRVKRHVTGMIVDPITLAPDQRVADAMELTDKYGFSGFPVTQEGELVGILSNRDMRFEDDMSRLVSDLMTPKERLITAPVDVPMDRAKRLLHDNRIEKLLVTDDKGRLVGLITIKDIEKSIRYPHATKDEKGRLRVGAAVGVGGDRDERVAELIAYGCDLIVVDTAHGHSKGVVESVKAIRKRHTDIQIVAGNVATPEAVRALIGAGADAVKVGIGPGSICTTRIVAGVGVPQITAVNDCAREASLHDIPIIADGGIKHSGDVVKAIAAGADCVMIGGLFAGVDESPGDKILYQGRVYKEYRGMGSIGAMTEGSADRYFQDKTATAVKLVPEGVEGRVPYKGELTFVVHQLTGGVRSGMGYCGAATIPDLQEKGRFVRISNAGLRESHVHDIQITKEAPNYTLGSE